MSKIFSFTTVNKRENNEDSCLAYKINVYEEEFTILLLSDGMGGHEFGEIISNVVISTMSTTINNNILKHFIYPALEERKDLELMQLLYSASELTNQKIVQLIKSNKWKGGGATLVAVIIYNNKYYWSVLGDSRLYHISLKDKVISQIGFDHNVPGILLHQGAISTEVAKYHAQRNQLVYFMGMEKFPTLKNLEFIGEGNLAPDDILFLCSDGLTGKIDDNFLFDTFSSYPEKDISNIVKMIVSENQRKGETDNQTAVVFVNEKTISAQIEETPGDKYRKNEETIYPFINTEKHILEKGIENSKEELNDENVIDKAEKKIEGSLLVSNEKEKDNKNFETKIDFTGESFFSKIKKKKS